MNYGTLSQRARLGFRILLSRLQGATISWWEAVSTQNETYWPFLTLALKFCHSDCVFIVIEIVVPTLRESTNIKYKLKSSRRHLPGGVDDVTPTELIQIFFAFAITHFHPESPHHPGVSDSPWGILFRSRTALSCDSIVVPSWPSKAWEVTCPALARVALLRLSLLSLHKAVKLKKKKKVRAALPSLHFLLSQNHTDINRWLAHGLGIVCCGSWHSPWKWTLQFWPAVSHSIVLRHGLKRTGNKHCTLFSLTSNALLPFPSSGGSDVGLTSKQALHGTTLPCSADTTSNIRISVWSQGSVPVMQVTINRHLENLARGL